jgi:cell division protease FtsH
MCCTCSVPDPAPAPPTDRPPAPDQRETPQRPPIIPRSRGFLIVLLALLAVNLVISFATGGPEERQQVPYQPFFVDQVKAGNVTEISSQADSIEGELEAGTTYDPPGDEGPVEVTTFETQVPAFIERASLTRLLTEQDVVINAEPPDEGRSLWATLLLGFLPTLLLIGFFVWLIRRQTRGGAGGVLGSFGRSTARRFQRGTPERVTFDDVAGIDEAEDELVEIVDFLKRPGRYRKLGARIPRGVLLYGPPGTGKTLLARAVAGEADASFLSLSASEFVEAIVGVGASRVRDLFKQAKEEAPAIVFIDELDAIGRSRSGAVSGISGGHDEREQTLNQILTEMDGFDASTGVIVIGATNRPEVLDPALLRPGRFDRRVAVQPPDRDGREQILRVHTRGVPLAPNVDLGRVAASTPGMVGADLANLVNEAALLAARRNHEQVEESDFTDALERIVLGAERQIMIGPEDRRRTAYHEAGHAIVGMLTDGADPVRKISIIPRATSLGVTFSAPEADRYNYQERELQARIKVALGGRGAEEVVYGEPTTGAESDIQQLTEIARHMVGRWGMSDSIGPLAVIPADGRGPVFAGGPEISEQTQRLIDEEVRRIVEEAHQEVVTLLRENRSRLDSLAEALLEHETLDEDAAYAAARVTRTTSDAARERAAAAGAIPRAATERS